MGKKKCPFIVIEKCGKVRDCKRNTVAGERYCWQHNSTYNVEKHSERKAKWEAEEKVR